MKKILLAAVSLLLISTVARAEDVVVTVDVSEQAMLVETPVDSFIWPVSTGREGYRTPRGVYQPYRMAKMHYSSKYENAPMPHSIFFHGGYAIHATYDIKRLGRPASHGCVRLAPRDAQWLYHIVKEYGQENTTIVVQE